MNQGHHEAEVISIDHASRARAAKVDAIVSAIDTFNAKTGNTHEAHYVANRLREWTQSEWDCVAKAIGVKRPSRTTQLIVIDTFERRALSSVLVQIDEIRAQMGLGGVR